MLLLNTRSFRHVHLSRERAHITFDLLLCYFTLFLFFAILSVLRCVGSCFRVEFWRTTLASVWVLVLRILTVDQAEIEVV